MALYNTLSLIIHKMDIMETWYYYFTMTLRTLTLNWLACFPASNLSFLLLLSPFHYRKKFICYCTFIKGHSYSRKISKSGSLWYCDCAQTNFEKCAMVYSQNSLWKLHARPCSKLQTNMVSTFSKFVFFYKTWANLLWFQNVYQPKRRPYPSLLDFKDKSTRYVGVSNKETDLFNHRDHRTGKIG